MVPVYDADRDDLISLQFIGATGDKKFLAGGRSGGGHCRLGLLHGAATIIVCEGYATGATLHGATGDPVAIAFRTPPPEEDANVLWLSAKRHPKEIG